MHGNRNVALWLLLSWLLVGCAHSHNSKDNSNATARSIASVDGIDESFLNDVQCREQVLRHLETTGVKRQWSTSTTYSLDGSKRYYSPTNIVGLWVELRVFLNREVQLRRITAEYTELRNFIPGTCTVKVSAQKKVQFFQNTQRKNRFTDRDLRDLLATGKKGLIYIWSPNMPLSLRPYVSAAGRESSTGFNNVTEAARKFGLEVTYLLDPVATHTAAQRVLRTREDVEVFKASRSLASIELSLRAAQIHYPSVIVYANGKLARFSNPGVSSFEQYSKYIEEQLNALK